MLFELKVLMYFLFEGLSFTAATNFLPRNILNGYLNPTCCNELKDCRNLLISNYQSRDSGSLCVSSRV